MPLTAIPRAPRNSLDSLTATVRSRLVLHADDFGMNAAVTDGILAGFAEGPLTSTAVLANAPDAARALGCWKELARDRRSGSLPSLARRRRLSDPLCEFDLGVHLNLTQGRPLSGPRYPAELLDAEGRFPGVFRLFRRLQGRRRFRAAVEGELASQIEFVLDHGLRPTHLNGHQYVELFPAVAEVLPPLMNRFGIRSVRAAVEPISLRSMLSGDIPLRRWLPAVVHQGHARRFCRQMDRLGIAHAEAFFGSVHAGRVHLGRVSQYLKRAEGRSLVEIGMHPGREAPPASAADEADGWRDPLAQFRPGELRTVLSSELWDRLHQQQVQLGRLGA